MNRNSNPLRPRYQPGTLHAAVRARCQRALESGALEPIHTTVEIVMDQGIPFILRVVDSLKRKHRARHKHPADFNPFLPVDEELWVADISDTHVGVLNKFNVLDEHLLIVTRAFESQTLPLTLPDFSALTQGLAEIDGLAFYNSGPRAGASQAHKHLQLVPLPLSETVELPIDAALQGKIPLPFPHAHCAFSTEAPEIAHHDHLQLLDTLSLTPGQPYNLLATRKWMMIVPRRREHFEGISINALGFAGALLARDEETRDRMLRAGPINVLKHVAGMEEPL